MTNLFFIYVCLANGNDGTEGWLQILFPIVIAIFWAISGISKAKSQQSQPQNRRKVQQSTQTSHSRQPGSNSQIRRDKFDIKQHFKHKPVDVNKLPKNTEPAIKVSPNIESQTKEVKGLMTEPIQKPEDLSSLAGEGLNDFSYPIFDFTSQDQLKKAILLTEIFGKPLSLRELEDF
jgi:hypothetical protein